MHSDIAVRRLRSRYRGSGCQRKKRKDKWAEPLHQIRAPSRARDPVAGSSAGLLRTASPHLTAKSPRYSPFFCTAPILSRLRIADGYGP